MRCAGIPADPAYGQLMVRAVRSEFKSGVKRGKRNAKEAGGIQHMVVSELQAALKKKSDRSRQLARKLMAVQEQLRSARDADTFEKVLKRDNPTVACCQCEYFLVLFISYVFVNEL